MRILQTLVSTDGYRDWRGTADRMTILSTLLGEAARRGCGLVVLPAGFLQARRPDDVELLQNAVVNLVKKTPGVGVVLGIDAGRVTKATLHHRVLRRQPLPYSGLAIEPGGNKVHRWQQQSFLSSHGTAANAISIPARTIDFHGKKVLVLLCGEMFNHAMQAALCGQGLDLIVEATTASGRASSPRSEYSRGTPAARPCTRSTSGPHPAACTWCSRVPFRHPCRPATTC
jgi:hypothetical protein